MSTKDYRVTRPFWNGPHLMSVGDTLHLTDDQAKYRGDEIELVKGVSKPDKRVKDEASTSKNGAAS